MPEQARSPRTAYWRRSRSVICSLSAPAAIRSAESRSTSAVVLRCMKPPVSVMIVVSRQVAISGVDARRPVRGSDAARTSRSSTRPAARNCSAPNRVLPRWWSMSRILLALDRRQKFARPAGVAHVAEHPERVRGQIRGNRARHRAGVRQEAEVARHRVLLEVVHALAQSLATRARARARAQRVAVGLHVGDHHERRPRAKLRDDLFGSSRRAHHFESSASPRNFRQRPAAGRSRAPSCDPRRTSAPAYAAAPPRAPVRPAKSARRTSTRPSSAGRRDGRR